MAITYTWKITGLKTQNKDDANNVVVQTYWEKIGTDENGNEGKFSGATPFSPKTIDSSSFVSFENLTEDTVLGWIKNIVIGSYEDHVNEQIQKQIDHAKAPIEEPTLPWKSE